MESKMLNVFHTTINGNTLQHNQLEAMSRSTEDALEPFNTSYLNQIKIDINY